MSRILHFCSVLSPEPACQMVVCLWWVTFPNSVSCFSSTTPKVKTWNPKFVSLPKMYNLCHFMCDWNCIFLQVPTTSKLQLAQYISLIWLDNVLDDIEQVVLYATNIFVTFDLHDLDLWSQGQTFCLQLSYLLSMVH